MDHIVRPASKITERNFLERGFVRIPGDSSRLVTSVVALAVIAGAFGAGTYVGYSYRPQIDRVDTIANKEDVITGRVDFNPFWKAWNVINEKWVDAASTTVTDEDKVWGAIEGLAASLKDPYTVFFPPAESEIFATEISGNFEGVGMELDLKEDVLTVVAPLKGSPAEKAGIHSGDRILKIDGKVTRGFAVDEAVKLIRGKRGTSVVLTIAREGEHDPKDIPVVRDVITIPTVETKLRPDGVFTISLRNFSAVAAGLFRQALREFVLSGSDKLLLDLRGNPGGYLEASVDMASWFLPPGEIIVREDFGGTAETQEYRSKGYDIFSGQLKFVILIDGASASASEILAGALKEHGVATLIGTNTYGKGSVQELVEITPETSLKITVARWLTPSGKSISEGGVAPNIEVKVTEDDIKKKYDRQFETAVEFLLKME